MPDVVVVGCGGGGAVIAYELASAGVDVLVLEAGPWHDPDASFTREEWPMFNTVSGVFRWGPADRSLPPWRRETDGLPVQLQTAGVGGNTLHFIGNCPRAYPASVDGGPWPLRYADLVPYYEKVESLLPVREPADIARRDELFIAACERRGLPHRQTRDVSAPGWRLQPNSVGENCTNCGHCLVGCAMPADAPLPDKAKRGTNVSYAPMAVATGRCEIRTECFATRVLTEPNVGAPRARGVRYRRASGEQEEAEGRVVVLAAGAVETPRLWLGSGLPTGTPVGRYLTCHWPEFLVGVTDEDTDIFKGMQALTRADVPGEGFFEPLGTGPLNFALVSFGGEGFVRETPGEPWATRGRMWGAELRARMDAYPRSLVFALFCDDEEHPDNRVELSEPADEHGPIPRVVYRPTPDTVRRREALTRRAAEVLVDAGCDRPGVHRADAAPSTIHQMGTMRMGADPSTSVVDAACESHDVRALYVADCSILPNGIGGANPTLTCQALATRTAERIIERHL